MNQPCTSPNFAKGPGTRGAAGQADGVPNREASAVAERLVGEFISRFGIPRAI